MFVCAWRRLALCPSVILLSAWTISEQLVWPSCTLDHETEKRMLCTAFRTRNKNRNPGASIQRTNLIISRFIFYLPTVALCLYICISLSYISPRLSPLGQQWLSVGHVAPFILAVQYWHRCCGEFKGPDCAISRGLRLGSRRGILF